MSLDQVDIDEPRVPACNEDAEILSQCLADHDDDLDFESRGGKGVPAIKIKSMTVDEILDCDDNDDDEEYFAGALNQDRSSARVIVEPRSNVLSPEGHPFERYLPPLSASPPDVSVAAYFLQLCIRDCLTAKLHRESVIYNKRSCSPGVVGLSFGQERLNQVPPSSPRQLFAGYSSSAAESSEHDESPWQTTACKYLIDHPPPRHLTSVLLRICLRFGLTGAATHLLTLRGNVKTLAYFQKRDLRQKVRRSFREARKYKAAASYYPKLGQTGSLVMCNGPSDPTSQLMDQGKPNLDGPVLNQFIRWHEDHEISRILAVMDAISGMESSSSCIVQEALVATIKEIMVALRALTLNGITDESAQVQMLQSLQPTSSMERRGKKKSLPLEGSVLTTICYMLHSCLLRLSKSRFLAAFMYSSNSIAGSLVANDALLKRLQTLAYDESVSSLVDEIVQKHLSEKIRNIHEHLRSGQSVHPTERCSDCGRFLIVDSRNVQSMQSCDSGQQRVGLLSVFGCGHIYHLECLQKKWDLTLTQYNILQTGRALTVAAGSHTGHHPEGGRYERILQSPKLMRRALIETTSGGPTCWLCFCGTLTRFQIDEL